MKESLILFLKGIVIGIAKIIPGVSGALLAISFHVYEKGIEILSNPFQNIKENLNFLFPLGLGIVIAVVGFSNLISYFLNYHYFLTILLFIGLILGGIPDLLKKIHWKENHNFLFFLFFFFLFFFLMFDHGNSGNASTPSFLGLILLGVLEAITIVVPGISGTALLMAIGYYDFFLKLVGSMTSFSNLPSTIHFLLPIFFGMVIGILATANLMNSLFQKHFEKTYCAISGCFFASLLIMISFLFKTSPSSFDLLIGPFLFLIGIFLGKHFS